MWACVFSTAYFARSGAGFESQWRLIEVVPGRAGSYRLDRGGSLAGGAPAAQGTPVSENVSFPRILTACSASSAAAPDRPIASGSSRMSTRSTTGMSFPAISAWSWSRRTPCAASRSATRSAWPRRGACPDGLRRRCTCAIGLRTKRTILSSRSSCTLPMDAADGGCSGATIPIESAWKRLRGRRYLLLTGRGNPDRRRGSRAPSRARRHLQALAAPRRCAQASIRLFTEPKSSSRSTAGITASMLVSAGRAGA
jgi:hypothetical protein